MVYKTDLAIYGFETIEQYFEYVIESHINGQHKQVVELIKTLSKDQKKDFIDWCNTQVDENVFEGSAYYDCSKIALNLI